MVCFATNAQKLKPEYAIIPDSLKKNADVIIRVYNTEIERSSLSKMTHKIFIAITVINKKGDYDARIFIPYDKQSKVISVGGRIYNSAGALTRTIKPSDFYDTSNYSDVELFSDNRIKVYSPNVKDYPYTVEYDYEISYSGHLHIESWYPADGIGVAVQKASLKFITPPNLDFKVRSFNYSFGYKKESNSRNLDVHHWTIKNLQAFKSESYMPDSRSWLPHILLVPGKFEFDGSTGELSSWNSLGLWSSNLLKGRMILPESTVLKIKEITNNLQTDRDKVKAVYEYMQNKTRYINISYGIGGFQPLMASDVDKYGYGDCKALSNYTAALLKSIGIPSNYTVIGAGSSKIKLLDLPSFTEANHVILTVPLANDTIWLECTNPHSPFGYVGSGNANRKALLISDDGGHLINMPNYSAADNTFQKKFVVEIASDGNALGNLHIKSNGLFFGEIGYLKLAPESDQKDYLLKNLPINNLSIEKFEIFTNGDVKPEATLNVKFKAAKYGDISGNRMFVPLNNIDKSNISFQSKKDRFFDVVIPYNRTNFAQSEFIIPPGFEIEFIPKSETVDSPFGNYSFTCEKMDGKVIYSRKFIINGGTVKKENYPELYDFFHKIGTLDNAKIVLKKL